MRVDFLKEAMPGLGLKRLPRVGRVEKWGKDIPGGSTEARVSAAGFWEYKQPISQVVW